MRVAIVHDWLTNLGGAERVVAAMLEVYPEADLYTSTYNPQNLKLFKERAVHTTFLQHVPLARKKHQLFAQLRRLAFEQLDLSGYDVVISSTTAEAKGVITSEDTVHISYMNTPTRYYWSHYDEYIKNPGFGLLDPLARWQLRRTISSSRRWDFAAAQRPDVVLANSKNVQERIRKYYKRDSQVLYPLVDTSRFAQKFPRPDGLPDRYALVSSRLVPYKRVDIAIKSARQAGIPLYIIGSGSQEKYLRGIAGETTVFLGQLSDSDMVAYTQHADVFLFPGEEDFGITPVEAMAAGVPVIAYGSGGAAETVIDGKTGILLPRQSVSAFASALMTYRRAEYEADELFRQAKLFSVDVFKADLKRIVSQSLKNQSKA
ncbi:MAG: glycosyltransferase [bacterium]